VDSRGLTSDTVQHLVVTSVEALPGELLNLGSALISADLSCMSGGDDLVAGLDSASPSLQTVILRGKGYSLTGVEDFDHPTFVCESASNVNRKWEIHLRRR